MEVFLHLSWTCTHICHGHIHTTVTNTFTQLSWTHSHICHGYIHASITDTFTHLSWTRSHNCLEHIHTSVMDIFTFMGVGGGGWKGKECLLKSMGGGEGGYCTIPSTFLQVYSSRHRSAVFSPNPTRESLNIQDFQFAGVSLTLCNTNTFPLQNSFVFLFY